MAETRLPTIYLLKVVLVGISPMIWRRRSVSGDCRITDLHQTPCRLTWGGPMIFRMHGTEYAAHHDGGKVFSHDPDGVRSGDFRFRINERFPHAYDVAGQAVRLVRIENILDCYPHKDHPLCVGGKRACTP